MLLESITAELLEMDETWPKIPFHMAKTGPQSPHGTAIVHNDMVQLDAPKPHTADIEIGTVWPASVDNSVGGAGYDYRPCVHWLLGHFSCRIHLKYCFGVLAYEGDR